MTISDKLITVAENTPVVYDTGYSRGVTEGRSKGIEEGREVGIEEGKKAEYDAFWDSFQQYGTLQDTRNMFGGFGWTKDNLKPKYSIFAKSTYMMFAYCGYNGDLADVFDKRGLTLKFELDPYNYQQGMLFFNSTVTAVGEVDLSPLNDTSQISSMFNSIHLTTIRNLIPPRVAMSASCWASGLINLGIGGDITKGFNISRCSKLTAESLQSVIDHLADLTGGTKQTLTLHSSVSANLTAEQANTILNKNWNVA